MNNKKEIYDDNMMQLFEKTRIRKNRKKSRKRIGGQVGFVGKPWGDKLSEWPNVNGVAHDRNFYKHLTDVVDLVPKMTGGNKRVRKFRNKTKKNKKYKGGCGCDKMFGGSGLKVLQKIETDYDNYGNYGNGMSSMRSVSGRINDDEYLGGGLVGNMIDDVMYNVKSGYNTYMGYDAPVNPLPYRDQFQR